MKIDMKDIKLGFWLGAGMAIFTAFLAVLTWMINRARNGR